MLPREHYLKQAFQDPIHFPDGFEKGGLSDIQARLIRKNGALINALSIDEVSDPTSEDLHLLKVIASQSSPKNPVEQAWVKYLSLIKNLATSNPKSKSKAKAAKPATETKATPEPVKPVEKSEKPIKATEKTVSPKIVDKTPPKKIEVAPTEANVDVKVKKPIAKVSAAVPAKKEKTTPEPKAPAKAATKKAEAKPAAPKKADVKKPEPKKTEVKKPEPKKAETKKPAPKVEAKKVAAKKPKK